MGFFTTLVIIIVLVYFYRKLSSLEQQIEQLRKTGAVNNILTTKDQTQLRDVSTAPTSNTSLVSSSEQNLAQESPLSDTTVAATQATTSVTALPTSVDSVSSAKPTQNSNSRSPLIEWLTTDWLLKIGALLLLLGIAWFVTYAFAENWIGPVGRISLGLLVGVLLLVFGEWRGTKSEVQGTIFMSVGAATIILTTYASRIIYDFFDPLIATIIMLAAVVMMSISSVVRNSQNRAILSLLLAAIIPFLTASTDSSVVALLSYAFIIIAGSIWIVSVTQWRSLTALSLAIYGVYSFLGWMGFSIDDILLTKVYVFAFGLLFYATSLIAHLRVKNSSPLEYFVSLGNAFLLSVWIHEIVPDHLLSFITSGVSLFFFVGAYITAKYAKQSAVVIEYVGVALALLAAAATYEFDGPTLSILYTVLICVGMYLLLKLQQKLEHIMALGLLFFPVFYHSLLQWQMNAKFVAGNYVYDNSHFLTWWILVIQLLVLGFLFYRKAASQQHKAAINLAAGYLISGVYLAGFSIWHQLDQLFNESDTAHGIALLIITVMGICLYFYGRINSFKKTMITGISLLVFVVLRLLMVEVWNMDLFQRVIVFSLIGILLMSTAFVKPRQENKT